MIEDDRLNHSSDFHEIRYVRYKKFSSAFEFIVPAIIVLKPVNEFLSGLSVLTELGEIWFRSSRNTINCEFTGKRRKTVF